MVNTDEGCLLKLHNEQLAVLDFCCIFGFKISLMTAKTQVLFFVLCILFSCTGRDPDVKVIGFLDAVEDATLALAREGFIDALKAEGWSKENGNLEIIFRNAQGDMNTLVQSLQLFVTRRVDLIAANSTISTISAVQRSNGIPVCMMVAPEPEQAGLTDEFGRFSNYLFGVYETLSYIDSSLALILEWLPETRRVGLIYNQAETQSLNALKRIREKGAELGLEILALPVTNSSETQLIAQSLASRDIDVFFALPDNIIFSSFEVIRRVCNERGIPIFTSEAGLVSRGAVAAYGADFYQWGYQAGQQAAQFFKSDKTEIPPIEQVALRRKVYNPEVVAYFKLEPGSDFEPLEF